MRIIKGILIHIFIILLLSSCEDEFTPKPRGYFRIDLPPKGYRIFDNECPYSFEYPNYSVIVPEIRANHYCWKNLDFPFFNARLHLSYKNVDNNINDLTEESRSLAFKHTIKADAIDEQLIINEERNVYGVLYNIRGNAASSTQFFLTDSTENFLRGALYFNNSPNIDSIAPVLKYIESDIEHLIQTFNWKDR